MLSLNAGQKYCRMLQREHSAILSTFIKLPFVIKIFVLSLFEWPFLHRFNCIQLFLKICVTFTQTVKLSPFDGDQNQYDIPMGGKHKQRSEKEFL